MKSDRKQTIFFIIILLVMSMGIGYAFLTTTLSIDGTSDIDASSWDVHFENVQVPSGSITGSKVITPATIGNNGTSVSYHIKLEPGDMYIFTVDVVNDGTLDAKVDNISIKVNGEENNIPSYLITRLFWYDYEIPVQIGQYLLSGETITYYYGIMYKRDLNISELPQDNQSLNITMDINYVQDHTPNYNNLYLFTSDEQVFIVDKRVPFGGVYYNNYQEPLEHFGHHAFLRHFISNNNVMTSEVGFELNGNIYYVKGGDSGASYESNKAVAQEAFGSSNCNYIDNGYSCSIDDYDLKIYNNGKVRFSDKYSYRCEIDNDKKSYCYYFPGY